MIALSFLLILIRKNMPRKSRLNKLKETILAVQDLNRNYWDMKRDNTVKGDDYFHCKANY